MDLKIENGGQFWQITIKKSQNMYYSRLQNRLSHQNTTYFSIFTWPKCTLCDRPSFMNYDIYTSIWIIFLDKNEKTSASLAKKRRYSGVLSL